MGEELVSAHSRQPWNWARNLMFLVWGSFVFLVLLSVLAYVGSLRNHDIPRVLSEFAQMQTALESYRYDHGDYPGNAATEALRSDKAFDSRLAREASKRLYSALQPAHGKVYFEFRPDSLRADVNGQTYVVDPDGESYGYSTSRIAQGGKDHYHLWSIAGDKTGTNTAGWIKNW